jgi:hypothetical protein
MLETRQQGWLMREIALVLLAAVRAGGDKGCLTAVSGDDVSHLMIASPCSQPALVEESRSHTATSTSQPASQHMPSPTSATNGSLCAVHYPLSPACNCSDSLLEHRNYSILICT